MTTKIPVELSSTPSIVDNGDATAITITSGENVGIGASSPNYPLTIHSTGDGIKFEISDTVDANYRIQVSGNDILTGPSTASDLIFQNGNTERMRIDSSGNIGVGTSSPSQRLHVDGGSSLIKSSYDANGTTNVYQYFATRASGNWRNSTIGNTGNALVFGTGGTGTTHTNATERARIDSSGNFMVGQTSVNYNAAGSSMSSGGLFRACVEGGLVAALNRRASDGVILNFYKDGTTVGSISTNGSSLPASDRNFKKDISDLNLGLDLVTKLKPSQFRFKVSDEDSPLIYGLIAQDLEESLTEFGVEKNSAWLLQHNPKEDVNESDYSLDYTALIPILINSIQEQQEQIEALQSEINTLKGGE